MFNTLTKNKDAIIYNTKGTTRDKNYKKIIFNNKQYRLIDTGGLSNEKNKLNILINEQTLTAIKESSLILFVLENNGCTEEDYYIANILRNINIHKIILVNKIYNIYDNDSNNKDFYKIGWPLYKINAKSIYSQ